MRVRAFHAADDGSVVRHQRRCNYRVTRSGTKLTNMRAGGIGDGEIGTQMELRAEKGQHEKQVKEDWTAATTHRNADIRIG